MSNSGIQYRTVCTGKALETVEAHSQDAEITMFGANFCPFVQRVWAVLEYKGIPYRYVECDPYKKPKELLELNPKGLVPALKLTEGRSLAESTYLEEAYSPPNVAPGAYPSLLPPLSDPYARARARLEGDRVNRAIVPAFYRYLQAQDPEKQVEHGREFLDGLDEFTRQMHPDGPFFSGSELGSHPAFAATCSTEDLYLDSYARYAENRPNTSQVANAINAGRGLP
ncbi:hypothetical protein FRB99_005094 [Tulasnella sp. 403]|nr:hypothetical protein FRB99_005094 [Tulasnella sp. 403]